MSHYDVISPRIARPLLREHQVSQLSSCPTVKPVQTQSCWNVEIAMYRRFDIDIVGTTCFKLSTSHVLRRKRNPPCRQSKEPAFHITYSTPQRPVTRLSYPSYCWVGI